MNLRLFAVLGSALLACGEADPPSASCAEATIRSSIQIRVEGWRQHYGDFEVVTLRYCLPGGECDIAAVNAFETNVECRPNASSDPPNQQCVLEPDGTLLVLFELFSDPRGEQAMTLELEAAGLEPRTGEATIMLRPREGNGKGCGITHAFGSVTVDATLQELTG